MRRRPTRKKVQGVEFWDANRKTRLSDPITVEASGVSQAVFSPDGRSLAVVDLSGNLNFWEFPVRQRIGRISNAFPGGDCNALTFSPDGRWVVRPGRDSRVIKLSDDGKLVAGSTGPGDMGVWKIPSLEGPPMWRAFSPLLTPTAWAFSADDRLVAAAIPNGELFIGDLSTRKRMVLPRTLTAYSSLAFSPELS